ncbi:MAG TPA: translocation/assembly module TamB domain-containing protein [Stellaceae bacterium]|nr:translocation/assembly module TamB domain-containing protein [Stellaceae bacterium]
MRRFARWVAAAVVLLVVAVAGGYGWLQTQSGLAWLGRTAAHALSSPGAVLNIEEVAGSAPFHVRAGRVEISDKRGVWLALGDVRLDISAAALLAGKVRFTRLTAASAEMRRLPVSPAPAPAKPVPWSERLQPPRTSYPLAIDRLAVDRIVLDPAVLGERVTMRLAGAADLVDREVRASLDLHRTDGEKGSLSLALKMGGAPQRLTLRLEVSEPSGLLLARLLHRTDRPPLALSLAGDGPVADWHGKLRASAGDLANMEADLGLKASRGVALQLSGTAAVARLLPPDLAPLIGNEVRVSARGGIKDDGSLSLAALSLAAAAGTLTGDAELGRPDHRIAGHLHLDLPHLAAAAAPIGAPVGGSARIDATLGGTEAHPTLALDAKGESVAVGTTRAAHASAQLSVTPSDSSAAAGLRITARGDIQGLSTEALPPALTRDIDWTLAARTHGGFATVDITRFAAHGAGIDIAGSGRVEPGGGAVDGKLHLSIANLSPLSGAFGKPVAGALALDATASREATGRIAATIAGNLTGPRSGLPAADALAGKKIALAASLHRDPGGAVVFDRLHLAGAAAALDGSGRFDPASRQVAMTIDGKIPDLRPLGPALGKRTGGRVAVTVKANGPAGRLGVDARLAASGLAFGTFNLDRLELDAKVPDISAPTVAVAGRFTAGDLDGTLSLDGDARDPREIAIPRLRLAAAGGAVSGSLRIDRATGLVRGMLDGAVPDLARWSRLAGMKLAGSVRLKAGFDSRRGQDLDLTLTGDRLAIGAGGTAPSIGHVEVSGKLNDLRGRPFGHATANLQNAALTGGRVARANLTLDSKQNGHLAFAGTASGRAGKKFSLDLAGDGRIAPGAAAIEIRLSRLAGSLAGERLRLERPLTLRRGTGELALAGLDLRFGPGRLTGDASIRGTALSLRLAASELPLAPAARLAGLRQASGTVGFTASLAGSTRAPHGRFSLSGRHLNLSGSVGSAASLGLDLAGEWNGRAVALNGRVLGLKGDTLAISGTVPLAMTAAPLGVSVPRDGHFALRLRGAGDLASLADLLPLGEDRLHGQFALDAAATGTLAAPSGSGSLTITGGNYENFATGAALSDLRLSAVGDQSGFVLRSLSATDGAQGTIAASGRLSLGAAQGPTARLDAHLSHFRVAARDLAVIAASGTIGIAGPLASPEITADLTTDGGEFRIPDPGTSITQLQVVRVGGPGAAKPAAASTAQPPALPARLDLRITVPGRIFVRGHGIASEWRGRLHITGTSAAPKIGGVIQAVRGTVDLLGKTFQVTEGRIDFEGGALDPALYIVAQVTARDITAQVVVSGLASAPKIALTSVPALPQDQILARVLFDRPLDQISVGEGLQVASAAATLAGGGPGIMDKLRNSLGLDRLVFGSGSGSADAGPAVSGGKYIANGVYVGATQGLTGQSSKVTVDIDVMPHVTVQTDVGAASGTGIGLNYKYDY